MPFLVIAEIGVVAGVAGAVGGEVANLCNGHKGKHGCPSKRDLLGTESVPRINVERAEVGLCNVPKYNFDLCADQVKTQRIRVTSSIPATGVAKFDNVPPACMVLAGALVGACSGDGPRPTPCGSACMQYTGLSDAQMRELSAALNTQK